MRRRDYSVLAYILPAALCLALVMFYPIVNAIWMSFQNYILYRPQEIGWAGLNNYVRLIEDPVFWLSLSNSGIWVLGSVIPQFVLGFAVALVLNERFRGVGLFRSIAVSPWALPGVVVGLMWAWMYNPAYGVINDILLRSRLFDDYRISWLSDPNLALWSVIIANIWRGIPFFAIMLLAGLQSVPESLYEAATIDGASRWKRFCYVTIPMLTPIIVVSTVIRIIWTFNYPDLIFVMTRGGPANTSQILTSYIMVNAYSALDYGYTAALSVTTLALILAFTIVYLKITKGIEASW